MATFKNIGDILHSIAEKFANQPVPMDGFNDLGQALEIINNKISTWNTVVDIDLDIPEDIEDFIEEGNNYLYYRLLPIYWNILPRQYHVQIESNNELFGTFDFTAMAYQTSTSRDSIQALMSTADLDMPLNPISFYINDYGYLGFNFDVDANGINKMATKEFMKMVIPTFTHIKIEVFCNQEDLDNITIDTEE